MRCAILPVLLLAACSSSDEQTVALKGAHSIVAEWATVARLEAADRVSATYARGMATDARSQLAAQRETLDPNDPAARLIDGLGAAPDAARLATTAEALGRLEAARAGR